MKLSGETGGGSGGGGGILIGELKTASIPLPLCADEDCSSNSHLPQSPGEEELFLVDSTATEHQQTLLPRALCCERPIPSRRWSKAV